MVQQRVDLSSGRNNKKKNDITLREVRLVKESFFKILTGIYHRRIDYPGYDFFFFFEQKTAYEMLLCDWSSDVCSSDLRAMPVTMTCSARLRAPPYDMS